MIAPIFVRIFTVRFDPSGRLLASAALDGTVCVWDVERRSPKYPVLYQVDEDGKVERAADLAFSRDGSTLACTDLKGTLRFWDVRDGTLRAWSSDAGEFVQWCADDRFVVCGGSKVGDDKVTRLVRAPSPRDLSAYSRFLEPNGFDVAWAGADTCERLFDSTPPPFVNLPLESHLTSLRAGPERFLADAVPSYVEAGNLEAAIHLLASVPAAKRVAGHAELLADALRSSALRAMDQGLLDLAKRRLLQARQWAASAPENTFLDVRLELLTTKAAGGALSPPRRAQLIDSLKQAVARGFRDWDALRTDKLLEPLREDGGFDTWVSQTTPADYYLRRAASDPYPANRLWDYTFALDRDPKSVEAYRLRARSLVELKRPDDAHRDFREVCRLRPEDPRGLVDLARVLAILAARAKVEAERTAQLAESVQLLEKAVAMGWRDLAWFLTDPAFEAPQQMTRFQDLMSSHREWYLKPSPGPTEGKP